ncbi:MAG: response regulator transcription factor [Clostridia bacterium]|nr:response regulator transcription factor [Clostridia bacterium]
MKKVLIVEDSEVIVKGLKYSLEQEDFEVEVAENVFEAKVKSLNSKFDICIIDITLPDGDGFDVCNYIKNNTKTPVIFLTAKDEEDVIVKGFDLGADDYIIKPFRTRELISRINNILRRKVVNDRIIKCNNLIIQTEAKRVYLKDKEIILTALEYKILLLLCSNSNKTVTREAILDKIWDVDGNFVNDNTLTVYIKRIREKLQDENIIKTIKSVGYRVDDDV